MGTKYIENTGTNAIYVGGKLIPPGEGRDIPLAFLPSEYHDPAAPFDNAVPPSLDELLAGLLAKGIAKIAPELPGLKLEALDRMAELEAGAAAPRKTLQTAIDAERLRRANVALDEDRANTARLKLEDARAKLAAAVDSLDHESDVDKHPALEAAVAEARAQVEALEASQA